MNQNLDYEWIITKFDCLSNMSYVAVEYLSEGTLKSFLSKNRENKLALKIVIQLSLHLARG